MGGSGREKKRKSPVKRLSVRVTLGRGNSKQGFGEGKRRNGARQRASVRYYESMGPLSRSGDFFGRQIATANRSFHGGGPARARPIPGQK